MQKRDSLQSGGWKRLGIVNPSRADDQSHRYQRAIVPGEDRFTPFALTISSGDTVEWKNKDTDDHTVVSDDALNTAGHNGTNHLLKGTDSNGGQPDTFTLRFNHPGTFVYYCRFYSHLDDFNQPVAPGPKGGIQEANGNFDTPMMGVITVVPGYENNEGKPQEGKSNGP